MPAGAENSLPHGREMIRIGPVYQPIFPLELFLRVIPVNPGGIRIVALENGKKRDKSAILFASALFHP